MTDKRTVYDQLKQLGINSKGWGASEINELPTIMMPQEEIKCLVRGWYESGFATLVATSQRLLLIDKKLLHLTIEDVRYDMIAEVDFNMRVVDSTVRVNTLNKTLRFTCMQSRRLRELTNYVQQRVMELRQQQFNWQQFEQTPVTNHQVPMPQPVAMTAPVAYPQMQNPTYTQNHFAKMSLTTKHNFLPKVPRRFRPQGG